MKELIKFIRTSLGLTQKEFAKKLSTTPLSINRWENGKVIPNNMAQKQIFSFCEANSLDLTPFIVEAYSHSGSGILYHGSKKGIKGEIAPISRKDVDFGKGFYMGDNPLQPLSLISGEEHPYFYVLKANLDSLKIKEIPLGLSWAMIIGYNRGYMEEYKDSPLYDQYAHFLDGYDMAKGPIADDRLFVSLTRFFEGEITDEALLHCLSALSLGEQYVALNEKACSNISIIEEHELSLLELSAFQKSSLERRREGLSLTKEMEIKYRRVGRYFDEIMENPDAS